ncbi:MBL fold metallo-hydrolase [Angustibacter sp. McL0619]|uniref:MBL fold metallo-hydrolase n=1 Tax=Angustibacter sp. McL0619 TaxID=3415676 RepID=UPI003CF3AC58
MAADPAVQLAPNVWRLRLVGDFVNGFAFREDDGQVTLVDCGLKRSPDRMSAGLRSVGIAHEDVTRILLTHAHSDHAGGVAEMARRTTAPVSVHSHDAGWVRAGKSPPLDQSLRLGRLMQRLMRKGKPAFEPVPVDEELTDGQLLLIAGGLRVLHTPGHSPGHASFLHEPTGVLITGDALFNMRGIGFSIPFFCTDFKLSRHTAHRFSELDFSVAAFTHGPHVSTAARTYVGEFLAAYQAG